MAPSRGSSRASWRRLTLACALCTGAVATVTANLGCGDNKVVEAQDVLWPGCLGTSGTICTVAGTGIAGDGADLQAPRDTRMYLPQDMTVGPDGRLYVADWNNHRVRVIRADGMMQIVAGVGEIGLNSDDPSSNRLNHPTSLTFNPLGSPSELVIAAWHNSKVKTVDLASASLETLDACGNGKRGFAGNGGPAAVATLDLPVGVVFDAAGNLLISDQANQMIRLVDFSTPDRIISTIAGTGHCADAVNPMPCVLGDDGPATAASFHFPIGQAASPGGRIALDAEGNIYVADTENFRLRRIEKASGTIRTFAGNGTWGFAGDGGPATEAQLGRLADVAVGADGSVYIADTDNSCVRVVSPAGIISTFAGQCGQREFAGDNGPATAALLDRPYGVEVTASGDVFVADTHNQRIRIIFH